VVFEELRSRGELAQQFRGELLHCSHPQYFSIDVISPLMFPDDWETEVAELLETFVPNLLSERKYEGFVAYLFQSEQEVRKVREHLNHGTHR